MLADLNAVNRKLIGVGVFRENEAAQAPQPPIVQTAVQCDLECVI